jgi:hypothetical protein
MIISSQRPVIVHRSVAAAVANFATLGIGAKIREALTGTELERREQLKDMSLAAPLRELLDREFKALGGAVVDEPLIDRISRQTPIPASVGRTPAGEVVLLQIPGSVLKDGDEVRRLLALTYALRGRTVRVLSPDLEGEPVSAFNGLKRAWQDEDKPEKRIDLEFVPMSHIDELALGKGDLADVLKLDLQGRAAAAAAAATDPAGSAGPAPKPPKRIRIFLASSQELRADRDDFDLYFRQQNDRLIKDGVYLEVNRWEYFLDAMSETRLQDEYNKAVRSCDIFVSLFFTKTGKFTEEEFDTAHDQFKKTGKPRIYTFFKNASVMSGDITAEFLTVLRFKEKLSKLGHFHTVYNDAEHLKRQFRDQLDRLLEAGIAGA